MHCHEAEELMFAARDRALPDLQRAALEQHVAGCASCRQAQAQLDEAASAWRVADAAVATPAVDREWYAIRRRLRAGVGATDTARRAWWSAPRWLAVGSAAVAAAVALVFGLRLGDRETAEGGLIVQQPTPGYVSYVVVYNSTESTMVYEEPETGWLLVWVGDSPAGSSEI